MRDSLCDLVDGEVWSWQGLLPFTHDEVPSCVGLEERTDWLLFPDGYRAYRVFVRDPAAPKVWLFTFDDERVHLVESFPVSATVGRDTFERRLGPAEASAPYPLSARLQRPLGTPGDDLVELIYASRGLALLFAQTHRSDHRLLRIRGFEAMPADEYLRRFVELPPMQFPE